jgi:hypothetical protein
MPEDGFLRQLQTIAPKYRGMNNEGAIRRRQAYHKRLIIKGMRLRGVLRLAGRNVQSGAIYWG